MTQPVKEPLPKPDDLSLVPITHMVVRENLFLSTVPGHSYMLPNVMHAYTFMHTEQIRIGISC